YPQYLVMLVLWERGTVTLKELGAELDLDSGTLSPLVKRLKAAGLVTTGRRAEDERSVEIALTGKGRSLRERARDIPAKIGCATQMQLEDIVALRTALGELADSLAESHTAMAAARSPRRPPRPARPVPRKRPGRCVSAGRHTARPRGITPSHLEGGAGQDTDEEITRWNPSTPHKPPQPAPAETARSAPRTTG